MNVVQCFLTLNIYLFLYDFEDGTEPNSGDFIDFLGPFLTEVYFRKQPVMSLIKGLDYRLVH